MGDFELNILFQELRVTKDKISKIQELLIGDSTDTHVALKVTTALENYQIIVDEMNLILRKITEKSLTFQEMVFEKRQHQQYGANCLVYTLDLNNIKVLSHSLLELLNILLTNLDILANFVVLFTNKIKLELDQSSIFSLEVEKMNNLWKYWEEFICPAKHSILYQLVSVMNCSFFVVNQPQQVIKHDSEFNASISLLFNPKKVFSKNENVFAKANVHIVNSDNLSELLVHANSKGLINSDYVKNHKCGQFENGADSISMTLDEINDRCDGVFSLKLIPKSLKKPKKMKLRKYVTELKYFLLFTCDVRCGDMEFTSWCLSLPIVIVTNSQQDPEAWATVTYHNAFFDQKSAMLTTPFNPDPPHTVNGLQLLDVLDQKFQAFTARRRSTGETDARLLSMENRALLMEMLGILDQNSTLSYESIFIDYLPERKHTFWQWFYGCMKVTKNHMQDFWLDGTFAGFCSKMWTQSSLERIENLDGTFIVRFSEFELETIVITHLYKDNEGNMEIMGSLHSSSDFEKLSFFKRLKKMRFYYTYLYNKNGDNICIEQAFMEHFRKDVATMRPVPIKRGITNYFTSYIPEIILK